MNLPILLLLLFFVIFLPLDYSKNVAKCNKLINSNVKKCDILILHRINTG